MQQNAPITQKKCSICGKTKEITEFLPRKTSKDGYRNQCSDCKRKADRDYNNRKRDLPVDEKRTAPIGVTRKCRTCGIEKDLSHFRVRRGNLHDRAWSCKDCTTKKEWRAYAEKFEK